MKTNNTMAGWNIICLSLLLICSGCNGQNTNQNSYMKRRINMVDNQIKSRGVSDQKVLNAMLKVERHKFVPPGMRLYAYNDHALSIGEGQTISQPYIVAIMTETLELDRTKKVLEIGTGSGYQAAILAEICDSVFTIEIIENLGKKAAKLLSSLNYDNIYTRIGDGYQGWKEHSPFDAIIVTCAPTHIPQPLKDQLAEGGKMIIPVGGSFAQELILLTKDKGKIKQKDVIPVRFVPMVKKDGVKY